MDSQKRIVEGRGGKINMGFWGTFFTVLVANVAWDYIKVMFREEREEY